MLIATTCVPWSPHVCHHCIEGMDPSQRGSWGITEPLAWRLSFRACGWARTFSGAVKPKIAPCCFSPGSQTKQNAHCRPWPLAHGCRISGAHQDPSCPVSRKMETGNSFGSSLETAAAGLQPSGGWEGGRGGDILKGRTWEPWGAMAQEGELVGRNLSEQLSLGREEFLSLLGCPCLEQHRGTSWLSAPRTERGCRGDGGGGSAWGRAQWVASPCGSRSSGCSPAPGLQTFARQPSVRFLLGGASRGTGKVC